jgi:hypothetical protein
MPVFLDLPNGGCVNVECVVSIVPYYSQSGKQSVRVNLCDDTIELEVSLYETPQQAAENLRAELKSLCKTQEMEE